MEATTGEFVGLTFIVVFHLELEVSWLHVILLSTIDLSMQ